MQDSSCNNPSFVRSFSSSCQLVSLSFDCFLAKCAHTVAQVCALFTSLSSSCFMRTLSDLFDLSIHFVSGLFVSLIFLLFFLPYTFYIFDFVENKPAPWTKRTLPQVWWRVEEQKKTVGGCNNKKIQYFIDPSGLEILDLRVLQGHSGCNLIGPSLQDNILVPDNFFE